MSPYYTPEFQTQLAQGWSGMAQGFNSAYASAQERELRRQQMAQDAEYRRQQIEMEQAKMRQDLRLHDEELAYRKQVDQRRAMLDHPEAFLDRTVTGGTEPTPGREEVVTEASPYLTGFGPAAGGSAVPLTAYAAGLQDLRSEQPVVGFGRAEFSGGRRPATPYEVEAKPEGYAPGAPAGGFRGGSPGPVVGRTPTMPAFKMAQAAPVPQVVSQGRDAPDLTVAAEMASPYLMAPAQVPEPAKRVLITPPQAGTPGRSTFARRPGTDYLGMDLVPLAERNAAAAESDTDLKSSRAAAAVAQAESAMLRAQAMADQANTKAQREVWKVMDEEVVDPKTYTKVRKPYLYNIETGQRVDPPGAQGAAAPQSNPWASVFGAPPADARK